MATSANFNYRIYFKGVHNYSTLALNDDKFAIFIDVFQPSISSRVSQAKCLFSCEHAHEELRRFFDSYLSNLLPHNDIRLLASQIIAYAQTKLTVQHRQSPNSRSCRIVDLSVHLVVPEGPNKIMARVSKEFMQRASIVLVTKKVMASFKKIKVSNDNINVEEERCSICLENFEDDEDDVLAMLCDHMFHKDCIAKWLQSNYECPLCRF